uniref:Uncharacterized protein n=1 Tax=Solanum lycopersicum TaxID=4081 RepID=A0A3Q7G3Z3_SOLLC
MSGKQGQSIKLKCNHFMGSKAFVASRAEIGEQLEGVEPDRIEFYKDTHYSVVKGWSSQHAETNCNSMNDLKLYILREESLQ